MGPVGIQICFCIYFTGEIENWWDPNTEATYKERAQCIIDLYSNFTDPQTGMSLNGVANQGENIADIGGAKEAYKGYCKYNLLHVPIKL